MDVRCLHWHWSDGPLLQSWRGFSHLPHACPNVYICEHCRTATMGGKSSPKYLFGLRFPFETVPLRYSGHQDEIRLPTEVAIHCLDSRFLVAALTGWSTKSICYVSQRPFWDHHGSRTCLVIWLLTFFQMANPKLLFLTRCLMGLNFQPSPICF